MSFSEWIIDRTGAQTMLYLTCTMMSSVDLARYGVPLAKDFGIWGLWYKLESIILVMRRTYQAGQRLHY